MSDFKRLPEDADVTVMRPDPPRYSTFETSGGLGLAAACGGGKHIWFSMRGRPAKGACLCGKQTLGVDQRPNGCTLACIATLTGIPLDEFPHPPEDAGDDWFESAENRNAIQGPMHTVLEKHGWFLCHLWKRVPVGFAIAGGTSPRGIPHSVVVKDGKLWHDPHPSRAGLVGEPEGYDILVKLVDKGTPFVALPHDEEKR